MLRCFSPLVPCAHLVLYRLDYIFRRWLVAIYIEISHNNRAIELAIFHWAIVTNVPSSCLCVIFKNSKQTKKKLDACVAKIEINMQMPIELCVQNIYHMVIQMTQLAQWRKKKNQKACERNRAIPTLLSHALMMIVCWLAGFVNCATFRHANSSLRQTIQPQDFHFAHFRFWFVLANACTVHTIQTFSFSLECEKKSFYANAI